MARYLFNNRFTWRGSFAIGWSRPNQAWVVLYSPKRDMNTASVIGVVPNEDDARRVAGFPPRKRKRTRTRRRR